MVGRGEAYIPRVEVQRRTATRFVARVRGSQAYRTLLGKSGERISGSCTCPFFEGGPEPCKHLWATVRVAERMGWFEEPPPPKSFHADFDLDEGDGGEVTPPAPPAVENVQIDKLDEDVDSELEDEEDDDDDDGEDEAEPALNWAHRPVKSPGLPLPSWREALETARTRELTIARDEPATTRLRYVILPHELRSGHFHIHLAVPPAPARLETDNAETIELMLPTERSRRLGADAHPVEHWLLALLRPSSYAYAAQPHTITIDPALFTRVVRELCGTGRCHLARRAPYASQASFIADARPLAWDGDTGAYRFEFELADGAQDAADGARLFQLRGWLVRGEERIPLSEAIVVTASGLVAWEDRAAPLEPSAAFPLAVALRLNPDGIVVQEEELETFVKKYHGLRVAPSLRLPAGYELEESRLAPEPVLDVRKPDAAKTGIPAHVSFQYGSLRVPLAARGAQGLDWPARRVILRDAAAEARALGDLAEAGVRVPSRGEESTVRVAARKLPNVVRALVERGWRVEAEGKAYRAPGRFALRVTTNIDWLELDAELEFGGKIIPLPDLLAALRSGATSVVLDDGSIGLLPEDWLARWGILEGVGKLEQGSLRFEKSELPLLSALVEGAPELDADAAFERLRVELERGARPEDCDPPASLQGQLRPYQKDGLAWLRFLERIRFGGCLADDMGLGKTIQLLAHLSGRARSSDKAPALVVAPRSVLYNWEREAARFAPDLAVLTHWGSERTPVGPHFADYDLVLTTYGLVRIDQPELAKLHFSFIVLDEAQAIKNADSHTARAARSLRADHHLALTGTPIENHLGELWSLFEFLNPGLLGNSKRLAKALSKSRPDPASAALVSRAVRPFLLRRTKAQVAPDLPERTEQTLYVELSPEERRRYDELAVYYRAVIRQKVETLGIESSTPQVLEALLRLRQAACHPGLLDEKQRESSSAKLDLLIERVDEVIEGNHKALVFSQFTSLLGILREELDRRGIGYEYLDGKTTNREERVDRFQNDPEVRLFLISLKAGGVGLNLTAADYVFILDPWWNPAAEAQAIDRAHRIGQTRHVVAYRIIAQGTVEEKVEALQQQKRALVASIIGDGAALGGKLTREDLELLLE